MPKCPYETSWFIEWLSSCESPKPQSLVCCALPHVVPPTSAPSAPPLLRMVSSCHLCPWMSHRPPATQVPVQIPDTVSEDPASWWVLCSFCHLGWSSVLRVSGGGRSLHAHVFSRLRSSPSGGPPCSAQRPARRPALPVGRSVGSCSGRCLGAAAHSAKCAFWCRGTVVFPGRFRC